MKGKTETYIYAGEGIISFFGLVALILGVTIFLKADFGGVAEGLLNFITGKLLDIPKGDSAVLRIVADSGVVLLINIITSITIGTLVSTILGRPKSYAMHSLDKILDRGPFPLFLIVLVEEILARWIPLGVIGSLFNNPVIFYALFLVANVGWAVFHLKNFEDKQDRNIARVMPQFIGGFFLAYLFIRYGFFVCLMVHYLFDVVLLVTRKEQPVTSHDWLVVGYNAIVAFIAFFLMGQKNLEVSNLVPWLFAIETDGVGMLSFWDYVILLTFVGSLAQVVGGVLLLDSIKIDKNHLSISTYGFGVIIYVGLVLVLNWLLAHFVAGIVARTFLIALLVSFLSRSTSGSMLARVWLNAPALFLIVVSFSDLGFLSSVILMGVLYFVYLIPNFIRATQSAAQAAILRVF